MPVGPADGPTTAVAARRPRPPGPTARTAEDPNLSVTTRAPHHPPLFLPERLPARPHDGFSPPRGRACPTRSAFCPVGEAGGPDGPNEVYRAPAERGLRVPGDLSVVGSDDLPEVRRLSPPLTTVRRPLAEKAATALHLLLRMRDGNRPESTRTELSTRPAERAGPAPPPVPPHRRPATVLLGGTAPWREVSGPRPR
ncbi:hypothetical protein DD630_27205 [Streptomyces sp. BSE7F]|nr:hypothetical protein DD630_27205 [Streptomyces sp. BSE7F]